MSRNRNQLRAMVVLTSIACVALAMPAFAGTTTFSGASDTVTLTPANGTFTYNADSITVTPEDVGGWFSATADLVTPVPGLAGLPVANLGTLSFDIADDSTLTNWQEGCGFRMMLSDGGVEVAILQLFYYPAASDTQDSLWLKIYEDDWTVIVTDGTYLDSPPTGVRAEFVFDATTLTAYVVDGSGTRTQAAWTLDLTDVPTLGDVTSYTASITNFEMATSAVDHVIEFDAITIEGPLVPDTNVGGAEGEGEGEGEGELPAAGLAALLGLGALVAVAAKRRLQ